MFEGRFDNRVAIVTGSAKGIGKCVAQRLFAEGAKIAIVDQNVELAKEVAYELDTAGRRAIAIQCDITDYADVRTMVEATIKKYGRIDILVNNAGITRDKIFHKMSVDQWNAVINTNLNGTFNVTSNVVPFMREQKYGRIVNVSSANVYGAVGQANYSASKAGIIGLTKTLAKELAKSNVTVNAVLPGFTATDMINQVAPDVLESLLSAIPMGHAARPEEQACAICFLASEEASFITGAKLDVNGGTF